ncbi:Tricorn protease C1 domain-containing protein [Pedobacter terrae]|uniref:Tricorn protease C1 domain-containing protein n=2 Tax=Pedobacter terrae TaxID=405671 RepID=A0A1G7WU79_9SPHI|nr:Tricorn protease C1 domain-containing protein [Pedobacter terrae]
MQSLELLLGVHNSYKMIKTIKILFYFLTLFSAKSLVAQTVAEDALKGVWKMRGYGKIIAIDDALVSSYDTTAISCTLNSRLKRDSILQMGTIKRVDQNLLTITEGIKTYTLDKIGKLPNSFEHNLLKSEDSNYNFDVFWNMMDENYPFFKERKIDWLSIKENYGGKRIKNKNQLRHILKNIIKQLNDGHTTLIIPKKNGLVPHYRTSKKTAVLEDKILERYVKNPIRYGESIKGNGLLNYGITENNVGYIQINNMLFFSDKYKNPGGLSGYDYLFDYLNASAGNPNHFEDEKRGISRLMEEIVRKLQGTDAVIIDLRFNSGGYDLVSLEILRHLITEETKIYSKKAKILTGYTEPQLFSILPVDTTYSKPVFLLISHQTASAPEVLALGSVAVKNITRIGSDTEGIFSDILEKKMPNGWTINLSNEVYQDINGTCYESIGIPPNKKINYSHNENVFIRKLKRNINSGDEAIEMVFKLIEK